LPFYIFFGDFITTLYRENIDQEVNSTSTEEEYIVEFLKDDFVCTQSASSSITIEKDVELLEFAKVSESSFDICSTGTPIVQGKTKYNKAKVNQKAIYLDISLSWGNKKNILNLTIFSPTGASYGPYKAKSTNKIVLRIKPKTGKYLQGGNWKLNVFGKSIIRTEYYTLKAAYYI